MSPPAKQVFPKLVVFDLDGTLWYPEMYMLWGGGGPPFKQDDGRGDVIDCQGTKICLMNDTRSVLRELHSDSARFDIKLAISSKTDEPEWAQTCLKEITVDDGISMKDIFKYEQISKISKDRHFQALHKQTGISYTDMIFFDNEPGNIQTVSRLGVHCVYTPQGFSRSDWHRGLNEWKSKYSQRF